MRGSVVARVEEDEDLRVAPAPMARRDEPLEDVADLDGGDCGQVRSGFQPDRVEQRGPGSAAGLQGGDDRVGPAGHHLVLAQAPAEGMAERAVRACVGVRPQSRRDVHRKHEAAAGGPTEATEPRPRHVGAGLRRNGPGSARRRGPRARVGAQVPRLGPRACGPARRCTTTRRTARTTSRPGEQTGVQLGKERRHPCACVSLNCVPDPLHDPAFTRRAVLSPQDQTSALRTCREQGEP